MPGFRLKELKARQAAGYATAKIRNGQADAHSQTAVNPRFITIYKGTDVEGNEGQGLSYGKDGQTLPPDPSKPYYGPGYRLDNPLRAGNCATCHTPMAAKISNEKNCGWSGCHTNLTSERAGSWWTLACCLFTWTGDAAEGISCDFCHKIGEVILDAETELPAGHAWDPLLRLSGRRKGISCSLGRWSMSPAGIPTCRCWKERILRALPLWRFWWRGWLRWYAAER